MEYLVIGAGGTGGSIAAAMAEAGKDVSVIARGEHLEAIQKHGMRMETTVRGSYTVSTLKACDMEHYTGKPDVVFICVKSYSIEETIPFIKRVSDHDTIIIPLLNIYGLGGKIQPRLPESLVSDGCIYIAAEIAGPGVIRQNGEMFRVVFGVREPEEYRPALKQIKDDLEDSGISAVLSDDIRRDAFQKYAFVSPMAACGLYYDVTAGPVQKPGKERETFISLTKELNKLAQAMGIVFNSDIVEKNLSILDSFGPAASASMQRDIWQGKKSEIDGLIFEAVRMGEKFGVDMPIYREISKKFGFES